MTLFDQWHVSLLPVSASALKIPPVLSQRIHRALVRVCLILVTLQVRNPAPRRGDSHSQNFVRHKYRDFLTVLADTVTLTTSFLMSPHLKKNQMARLTDISCSHRSRIVIGSCNARSSLKRHIHSLPCVPSFRLCPDNSHCLQL